MEALVHSTVVPGSQVERRRGRGWWRWWARRVRGAWYAAAWGSFPRRT